MAVTRIKNNQITDSTITYQKIANGTLVGSLFNPNLTFNSNISIVGNLQVSGNTITVQSIDTLINDPLVIFNNGFIGTPSYDIGILVNRNLQTLGTYGAQNAAWIWRESDKAFEGLLTTETGTTNGAIPRSYFANLIIGNANVVSKLSASSIDATSINASSFTTSGVYTASGNIVAASGTYSVSTITGALVVPNNGGAGITGNLYVGGTSNFTGNMTAGNIYLTGNINANVGGLTTVIGVFYGATSTGIGALYAGVPGFTPVVNTITQFAGNTETYSEVNLENTWGGSNSTADYVITADSGTDSKNYADFGILNSGYNGALVTSFTNGLGTAGYPADTYLYGHGDHDNPTATGGNLIIGTVTANKVVRVIAGAANLADIITTTTSSGFQVNSSTVSTSTTSGALRVSGGAGIVGALYVGGEARLPTLNSTTLVATNFSTGNAVISGAGSYIGSTTTGIANLYVVTSGMSVLMVATLNSTGANITGAGIGTLRATNFSSANAQIAGGSINATVIGNTTPAAGTFTYSNATTIYGGTATITTVNSTTANITTINAGTVNATTETVVTLNVTSGNITTLTGNAANVNYIYGNVANVRTLILTSNVNTIDLYSVNIGSFNAFIGNIDTGTFHASNLSTGNAQIYGGYADNFPIGSNVAAPGVFTTVNVSSSTNSVGIGTGAFYTAGGAAIQKDLYVGGNIYANTLVTVNKEILTVVDPLLYLSPSASLPYAYDIGFYSNFTGGSLNVYQHTGLVRENSNNYWHLFSNVAEPTGSTVDLASINVIYDTLKAGNLILANTQQATSTTTGVLVVGGGAGIGGNVYAQNFNTTGIVSAGTINTTTLNVNGTNITTVDAGNITAYGANITSANITTLTTTGVGTVRGNLVAASSASSTSTTTGALVVIGGTGIGGNLYVGGNFVLSGNLSAADINNTIIGNATPNTGAFTQLAATQWANVAKLNVNSSTTTDTLSVTTSATLSPSGTVTINPTSIGAIDNMNIGASYQGNAYVTNFKSTTSINAPTTGPIWLYAGTGTSGINNIPIGAIAPSTGVFTTINATSLQANTFANTFSITAIYGRLTNLATGNAVITGGYINSVANVYTTLATVTNFSTGNAFIAGGYADNFPIGANTASTGRFTNITTANISVTGGVQATAIGNVTPGTGAFTTLTTSGATVHGGNLVITSGTTNPSGSATAGALVLTGEGGAAIGGNVTVMGGMLINHSQLATAGHSTIIQGVNDSTLLYAAPNAIYDQVAVGGNMASSSLTNGAKLAIYSNDSVLLPVGSAAERPSGQGYTDVAGMLRFSTTSNQIEFYDGSQWQGTGNTFTVVVDAQYYLATGDSRGNVDGTNYTFTIPQASTTNGTIVSINGVLQLPDTAYSISGGTSLVFTEPPAVGDVIDVRMLSTTSTISSLSSQNGFNQFTATNSYLSFYTGSALLGANERWRIDTTGNLYPTTTDPYLGTPTNRIGHIFASNIDISGGTLSGVSLGGASIDNAPIGGNIASTGAFTTLYASTFANVQAITSNTAMTLGNATIINDDLTGYTVSSLNTQPVESFNKTLYRSGKFIVQLSDGAGNYQTAEILLIHNDTTPTIETYGVVSTGSQLANFSANIAGSTCWLNAINLGTNTLTAKVSTSLMKI